MQLAVNTKLNTPRKEEVNGLVLGIAGLKGTFWLLNQKMFTCIMIRKWSLDGPNKPQIHRKNIYAIK